MGSIRRPRLAFGFTAAGGTTLLPATGDRWAAAGDAALSFDPLSAQGLLDALFTVSPSPKPSTVRSAATPTHSARTHRA
jgi:hypothetical protein